MDIHDGASKLRMGSNNKSEYDVKFAKQRFCRKDARSF
jgi:hypothetical protein